MGAGYDAASKFNDIRYRAGDETVEVGNRVAALVFDPSGIDPKFRTPQVLFGRVIAIRTEGANELATLITEDEEIFTLPYAQTCVAHYSVY